MTPHSNSKRPHSDAGARSASTRPAPKRPANAPGTAAKPLTPTQRRYLRGMCHHLKPLVMLGNKGITDGVIRELDLTLDHHELVKVKLSGGDRDERQQQLDRLLESTRAELVQQIGHVVSLFRRNPDQPQLALPR